MAETTEVRTEKNPVGAAILSALFPGVGLFYVGNFLKGIAYIVIFAALIVLQVEGRGNDHVIFGLLIAGFYIFQIFDTYDEAKRTHGRVEEKPVNREDVSLFWAVTLVIIGICFQLAELKIVTYRGIGRLWPIILIGLGIKYVYTYSISKKGGENE